ncbi:lytic transglycosylase domain-containing protein [Silvanigrella aquatica]|uniref:Transglycosylase SLT domain-containing protein n=1 Tax=Silvanigrella aquatica TaxID=1915309 RepID=A0A1L4CWV1_9BACT|nr:lytic transglycosylase domain-containing protein [Silvanigrella aquatica]APJ02425.1 hypothetical protein AXG55_00120 [Silvanigrella aquatica]
MLPPTDYWVRVPEGQALLHVAKVRKIPCHELFLAAAGKAADHKLPADELILIMNFAKAACKTKNPDIIWQIALVESGFRMRIVHIEGKKVLTGLNAVSYLKKGLLKNKNVDIGPLQINWKANGSKFNHSPIDFLSGSFSVDFLSQNILKSYVRSCGMKWINCYHSYNQDRGWGYRKKIDSSGFKLKSILSTYL